ncbi:hypothetical protein MKC73_03270 [[Clostridium] innocuum]|nr:hypothetical protein [[Clostridium] innocuum]
MKKLYRCSCVVLLICMCILCMHWLGIAMPDNTVRITGICLLTAVAVNVYTGRNLKK